MPIHEIIYQIIENIGGQRMWTFSTKDKAFDFLIKVLRCRIRQECIERCCKIEKCLCITKKKSQGEIRESLDILEELELEQVEKLFRNIFKGQKNFTYHVYKTEISYIDISLDLKYHDICQYPDYIINSSEVVIYDLIP